ncbi:MAG: hypothetical protein GVY06_09210 [Alphaproteobacteria bacterium]|jgi:hypothetical protein|nr:hypothetical protein [Alphaproteobacteria bacterium]
MADRISGKRAPAAGPLALAAIFALILAGWRAAAILPAGADMPGANPFEERVTRLAATLAGPEAVRVSAHAPSAQARHVLVLVDPGRTPAGFQSRALEDLLAAAGLVDTEAGDRLVIRQAAFAPATLSRPSLMELAEVLGLLALAAWLGWLSLVPPRGQDAPQVPASPPAAAPTASSPARPAIDSGAMLAAARRDPVRTARVIRTWLSGEGARS